MPLPPVRDRLDAVNRVRAHQRAWLDQTRKRVAEGEPFAICNGDEVEEIFLALDIPVLAINYWNFLIAAQGQAGHFTQILRDRGYVGRLFFAMGLAASIEPEKAPWGGLPKPTIICGSGRSEDELRVCELWAQQTGAHCYPMEFSFPSDELFDRPADWWNYATDRWEDLAEAPRLEYRVQQERQLIGFLQQITGRSFDVAKLDRALSLVNAQMGHWAEARRMVAKRPCPVHIRDQMSMYQAMWHRGTPVGVDLVRAYQEEAADRVARGVAAVQNERIRLYYNGDIPAWSQWAEENFGAVVVANFYSAVPELYNRTVHNDDPLRTLAARHLFLFGYDADWIAHVSGLLDCDAVVMVEPFMDRYPPERSRERQLVERSGRRYLALPNDADDEANRERLRRFFEENFPAG